MGPGDLLTGGQIINALDSQVESGNRGINRVILRIRRYHKHEVNRSALKAWVAWAGSGWFPGIGLAAFPFCFHFGKRFRKDSFPVKKE
jgi:hypothetical protein